jgi:methylenetetrahydrofolate dehydrogenase (NADP+)/methenyltetrahydrofolate cyclohydrolase
MLINGKQIANRIKDEIRELLKTSGHKSLAIFYVGQNPVIDSYVNLKKRVGAELGIDVEVLRFDADVVEDNLIDEISRANEKYSGIIVQLPLPENLNKEKILNTVKPELDVDMLSITAYENFKNGVTEKLPTVVGAIKAIFDEHNIDLAEKKIVVVGKGLLVGKPISTWIQREGFDCDVVDRESDDLIEKIAEADVVISGAGVPSLIKPEMIKDGVILIDAGTSTSSGKITGDIDQTCYGKASIVSGVPGGVGPITVVNLFKNLFLK